MQIYLATDHAGFELKEQVKNFLIAQNLEVEDCGALSFTEGDDYPDFIAKAAEKVSQNPKHSFAIIFGKSGAGEEIVANKFKNVRAVLGFSIDNVRLSREHNNANILSIGSQFVSEDLAKELVNIFIKTEFSGDPRHVRRLSKITEIEHKNYA